MKHQLVCAALAAALVSAACGGTREVGPANVDNPDQFLYERGVAALADEKWLDAREYFRQVVDNYPQSPLRPEAKLGIGDAYLGESSAESLVLADNEYREFLTFYPTNPKADYAQYKLALSYFEQMRSADRDQTANPYANYEGVDGAYFETMGLEIVRGRDFVDDDLDPERGRLVRRGRVGQQPPVRAEPVAATG